MLHFGSILGGFCLHFGCKKSNEILDAFLEAKKGGIPVLWGPPGGMRGPLGRIMEGYESKFRQRIPAGIEGRGQELLSRV